jgi:hypothetical protein
MVKRPKKFNPISLWAGARILDPRDQKKWRAGKFCKRLGPGFQKFGTSLGTVPPMEPRSVQGSPGVREVFPALFRFFARAHCFFDKVCPQIPKKYAPRNRGGIRFLHILSLESVPLFFQNVCPFLSNGVPLLMKNAHRKKNMPCRGIESGSGFGLVRLTPPRSIGA